MAFIEKLDAASRRWPWPCRWAYLGAKWYPIALGGFIVIRLWLDRTGLYSLY